MSNDLPKPNSRNEKFLNAIATGDSTDLPAPKSRNEKFLDFIARNGGTGEGLTQDQKDKLNSIDEVKTELDNIKSLKTINIADGVLQLTEDYKQYCAMEDLTEILLPTTDKEMLEIHLWFYADVDYSLLLPNTFNQKEISIKANKHHEIIFEKIKNNWFGGVVYYG